MIGTIHCRVLMLALAASLPAPVALAQDAAAIELRVGEGRMMALAGAADSALVSDPAVADVQLPVRNRMFLFGKAAGRSSVQALDASGRVLFAQSVVVIPDLDRLRAELAAVPGARVSLAGSAIRLEGTVATPEAAARAQQLAEKAAGKPDGVVNHLKVAMASQVNLRVRVAEVSRTLAREIGFNFDIFGAVGGFSLGLATGRPIAGPSGELLRNTDGAASIGLVRRTESLDMNAVIDALEQDGLVSVLVEPNLTARSGETASFLSGGEFPIPVNQFDQAIVVEFKRFGVALDFTPTVLDEGRISLKVRPEVSELNEAASVQIRDIRVPGLSVRRAETTVELASGQSFAIAGLVKANSANDVRAVPLLGQIPILGALFRSSRFQRQETELVIIVTPYLVQPVESPAMLAIPNSAVVPAADMERLLAGRLTRAGATDPTGFILE